MNEVELIRAQLCVERQHTAAVSHALSAAGSQGADRLVSLEAFRQASVEYLAWILTRFEEREQVFHDLLRSRCTADNPSRRAAETTLALPGTSREALAKLETALSSSSDVDWTAFLRFFSGAWSARRDELDRLFEQQAKIVDWRAVSGIDADSIFDERSRYARVRTALPTGIEMPPTTSRI
ncbi:MAG: hypothetical protein ACREU6_05650 [Steroidobacteraceae bacterium]